VKRESDARVAPSQAEADHIKRENDARLAVSADEADRLKRANDEQLARAESGKAHAEKEKTELRGRLLQQFNLILETRDTAGAWLSTCRMFLFDSGKFTLRPLAREKLARVAGIMLGHPGLRVVVEGHTDGVGGDDYKQRLSEQRGSKAPDVFALRFQRCP
jgi:outer membrane protein OmpA-like peptidoglycan-associated protein